MKFYQFCFLLFFRKAPDAVKVKKKRNEFVKVERRASRVSDDTKKRLEELEQLPIVDTDLKSI